MDPPPTAPPPITLGIKHARRRRKEKGVGGSSSLDVGSNVNILVVQSDLDIMLCADCMRGELGEDPPLLKSKRPRKPCWRNTTSEQHPLHEFSLRRFSCCTGLAAHELRTPPYPLSPPFPLSHPFRPGPNHTPYESQITVIFQSRRFTLVLVICGTPPTSFPSSLTSYPPPPRAGSILLCSSRVMATSPPQKMPIPLLRVSRTRSPPTIRTIISIPRRRHEAVPSLICAWRRVQQLSGGGGSCP